MPRRRVACRRIVGVLATGLAVLGGCGHARPFRAKEKDHASSKLLDSGPTPKLSGRQKADVQVALGRSLEGMGHLAEAEAAYREALKKDSKRADAEDRLGVLCDERGDVKGATEHFARARKLEPKNPEILCDQGYHFYLQRRWADAEECLKRAIAVDPRHARSHNNLGLVLARQEDRAGALAEFARAGCDPSDAQANLGLVLALEGHFAEAKQAYATALLAKPASPAAREGLRATTVALAGGRPGSGGTAIARAKGPETGLVDPAVGRASAVMPSGPSR